MGEESKKCRVCVTGATGYLGSWLVKRLLEDGYTVNATIRFDPERKRDISYLTNLPGAAERLNICNADLDKPESFAAAFEGCGGVFHLAHPLDLEDESEETKTKRVVNALHVILQACLDSKTVKRVVYTSSVSSIAFDTGKGGGMIDETHWTDVDLIRRITASLGPYMVTKTLADQAAQEFADKSGLDLVTVIPTWVAGPFICPKIPDSVYTSMALIFGDNKHYKYVKNSSLVHTDDLARSHIFLFEYPQANGRYICSALDYTIEELSQFLSSRYPQHPLPNPESWKDEPTVKISGFDTSRLLKAGFKYENGVAEIFDGAIQSCKEKGIL